MKLKILSVDFPLEGQGIENASFWDAPSFSDYDAVIIDPLLLSAIWSKKIQPDSDGTRWSYSHSDGGFGRYIKDFFDRRMKEIELLANVTGGILVCIIRQIGPSLNLTSHQYNKDKKSSVNRYSWFPNSMLYPYHYLPVERFGESINLIDKKHSFSQYITALGQHIFHEAIVGGKVVEIVKPFATNKVGEFIGCEVPFKKGKIILLPPLKEIDRPKLSGIFIDCIRKNLHWNEPLAKPTWLPKYSLANEKPIKSEIDSLKEREKEIKKFIDEQEKKMFRLEMVKSLLYEQGKHGLEPSC